MSDELYHYTCKHSAPDIRDIGAVLPGHKLPGASDRLVAVPWAGYAWFTDLATPIRDALGLTTEILVCDRAEFRFRALDGAGLVWWPTIRRQFPWSQYLEAAPGARPAHWYVSDQPVAVIEAPRNAE